MKLTASHSRDRVMLSMNGDLSYDRDVITNFLIRALKELKEEGCLTITGNELKRLTPEIKTVLRRISRLKEGTYRSLASWDLVATFETGKDARGPSKSSRRMGCPLRHNALP
jgi:hypothetical protein